MVRFIIISSLFLCGCAELGTDSFVFVDTYYKDNADFEGDNPISFCGGVIVDDNIVATAWHCITRDGFEFDHITIKRMDGVRFKSKIVYNPKSDLAFIYFKEPITSDEIQPMKMASIKGINRGCLQGRIISENFQTKVVCGTFFDRWEMGISARDGMSGGPCMVRKNNDTYVFGVISRAYSNKNAKEEIMFGFANCQTF